MKTLITTLLLIAAISCFGYFFWYRPKLLAVKKNETSLKAINGINELDRLKTKGSFIKNYIVKHKFDNHYCFMVDMHIPSGRNRFFVYDLQKDSVEISGLVAHGAGSDTDSGLVFSNVPESNCTSLGVYRIGKSYNGRFGLAYKLYGLDSSNSNACKRFIVLHSFPHIPSQEVAPREIYRSLGCPMVAPSFLTQLEPFIDKAHKPVALWIFY